MNCAEYEDYLKLLEENAKMRESLDKLARLGNEPNYGNSLGNVIARQGLAELSGNSGELEGE